MNEKMQNNAIASCAAALRPCSLHFLAIFRLLQMIGKFYLIRNPLLPQGIAPFPPS